MKMCVYALNPIFLRYRRSKYYYCTVMSDKLTNILTQPVQQLD